MNYKELDSLYQREWNDTLIASTYAKAYLLKAKEENDSIEIADAYVKLGEISKIERGLKYADSILLITKNSSHKSYPARAHVLKSYLFYNNGNYNLSLKNLLIVKELATARNNFWQINFVKESIASIKSIFGEHDEALKIYKEFYIIRNANKEKSNSDFYQYLNITLNLSLSYV